MAENQVNGATSPKPNFILGDSVDEGDTASEERDNFSPEMQQNGTKISTYEQTLMEKRRRLR